MHMYRYEEEAQFIGNLPLTETISGLKHHFLKGRGSLLPSQRWPYKLSSVPVMGADSLPSPQPELTKTDLVPPSVSAPLGMAPPRFGQGESSP